MSTYSYFELQEEELSNSPEYQVNQHGNLSFHGLDLQNILNEHGTPLKVTYLPLISKQIQKAKDMFASAIEKLDYKGSYTYCYCTKSSHFSFILNEVLNNDVHIETSSAYDIPIIKKLHQQGKISKESFIVCNGYKRPEYLENIVSLINSGFSNTIPVLDCFDEFDELSVNAKNRFKYGIRIATEEIPNFKFYTSRLGIQPKQILSFYTNHLQLAENADLTMLHFFINSGIKDHIYYWNELSKCLKIYIELKKVCPTLTTLNIGGGFPFKNSLSFEYDYSGFVLNILKDIKSQCEDEGVPEPNIFTEFGSFTVAEASANFYSVLSEKMQNDRESWYMINNSLMTTLPDTWGIDQRFIVLPINNWHKDYKNVYIGGLTCDSMDFYDADIHNNKLFMPLLSEEEPQHIGFFNTGAYQEQISGLGGIKHCLIPSPKHIIIDNNDDGSLTTTVFREEQTSESMLKILGYDE